MNRSNLGWLASAGALAWALGGIFGSGSGSLLAPATAHGQSSAQLEEDQQRFYEESLRLDAEGKYAEAIVAAEGMLSAERKLAAAPSDAFTSMQYIAELQTVSGDWPAAQAQWADASAWAEKHWGATSWAVADARRGAELTTMLQSWPPAKFSQWIAGRSALHRGKSADRAGHVNEQLLAAAKESLTTYRALFGEKSAPYAAALSTYGEYLGTNASYVEATAVFREVVAINKAALGAEHPDTARALNFLGRALEANAQHDAARGAYEECLAIVVKAFGEGANESISMLNNLGTNATNQGDYAAARRYLERAYELQVKYHGADSDQAAHAGANLGVLLGAMGDLAAERRYAEHALNVYLKLHGENSAETALAMSNLGQLLENAGDLRGARAYLERSLAVERKIRGPDHPRVAEVLNNLGSLLHEAGEFQAAKAALEEALAIDRKMLGENHPDVAIVLNNLGTLMSDQADFAAARTYYEHALAIDEKAYGVGSVKSAAELNNLGHVHQQLGEYEIARRYIERAMTVLRATVGEEHPDYATVLGVLGGLCLELNDYTTAKRCYEQALAINRKVHGENHPATAHALGDLGFLASSLGDYNAAADYLQQALAIETATYGKDHLQTAYSLRGVAVALTGKGDYAGARAQAEEALEIFQKYEGPSHPDTAMAEDTLAVILGYLDDDAAALRYHLRALETTRKIYGDYHPVTVNAFFSMAHPLLALGDFAKARSYLEFALANELKIYGEDHPDSATTLEDLGVVLEWMGEPDAAAEMLRRSVESRQHNIAQTSIAASENEQLILTQNLRRTLDYYLSCLLRRRDAAEAAYRSVLHWKGGLMVRQRAERLAADRPELKSIYEELQTVVRQWTTLARKPGKDVAAWQKQLDALRKQKDELAAELGQRSAEFRQATAPASLADMDQALPADAALVDYLQFTFSEPYPGKKGTLRIRKSYIAFVLRKGRRVQMFDLGESESIDAAVDLWRATYGAGAAAQAAGAELRKRLWSPLAAAVGDAKLVLVSPDGALGKFPFAALPGTAPDRYLIDDVAVVMLPVPQLLPALVTASPAKDLPTELLVLGGVDYDRRGAAPTAAPRGTVLRPWERREQQVVERSILGGGRWQPLPGTDSELSFIRDLYYDATGLERGSSRIVPLRGAEATEEAFRRYAPKSYLLHVATHGFFAGEDKSSALEGATAGSQSDAVALNDVQRAAGAYSPGLLSGLVFAGANDPPPIPDDPAALAVMPDDGYLTADEIALMPLDGAELVVLSACESGLGKTAGGEGMLGIQRAFQLAGARSTISTLWTINDEATRRIMEEFYRNYLKKHLTPLESLRAAQRWALDNPDLVPRGADAPLDAQPARRLPPRFWAAFTLSGDWR